MTVSSKKIRRKDSIQVKIGLLMVLAVILLVSTCYLSYRNLSAVVSSIKIDVNPRLKLLSIREISMDLEKAENSVRLYTITRNPSDIKPYYNVISNIDEKINKLTDQCKGDPVLLKQTRDITKLIEENIVLWNRLLVLYKDDNVTKYLKNLSEQIDSASTSKQKKEKGILRRVFSRSPKLQIDDQAIRSDIERVVSQDSLAKGEMIAKESQLAVTGSELKGKFYDLITKMENEVTSLINQKAESAGRLAGNTYVWLILLSVSGGLLAIVVLLIIIRYVRKAYAYQEALENSKAEAEKLARTKELFVANMSHEIRTPVTAISGFTEQLLQEEKDEGINRSLKIIKSSSDHLLKIIDDILDFSKLQNDKLVLEKVDFSISRIVEEVYSLFEKQAGLNNSVLSCSIGRETPPVLSGDPFRLKQILINLVSNSVKFTRNGTVSFSVSGTPTGKDEIDLLIEVTDSGIGIDDSKLDVIFEDFTQAEMSTTRKYGGTGLGLSIVKKLIELHDGTIDIRSRKHQGTTIVCHIPCRKGTGKLMPDEPGEPVGIPSGLIGLKVLVVDDEEYNRLLFRKIFGKWKMNFNEAGNGMDALELLKENKYDILFMDMLMPGLDGLKTTKFIRQEMKIDSSAMPVIFISAAPVDPELQKYRDAGINSFLRKPFTERILLDTILETLGKKSVNPERVRDDHPDPGMAGPEKLDLASLYHIAAGDELFVNQMLISFEETTRRGLKEIESAAEAGQWDSAADQAHRLMPPCRHLGATGLYNLLRDIENNSRNRTDTGSVKSLTERSFMEFELICEALEMHIRKKD